MSTYLIGDTIRLKATIKNMVGEEEAPGTITISVKELDGIILLDTETPTLTSGTTAQYYYDWTVSTGITTDRRLAVIWNWTGPHKKKMMLNVIPIM